MVLPGLGLLIELIPVRLILGVGAAVFVDLSLTGGSVVVDPVTQLVVDQLTGFI